MCSEKQVELFKCVSWFLLFRWEIIHENHDTQNIEGRLLGMLDYQTEMRLLLE